MDPLLLPPELKDYTCLYLDYKTLFSAFGEDALVTVLEIYPEHEEGRRQEIFGWAAENGQYIGVVGLYTRRSNSRRW